MQDREVTSINESESGTAAFDLNEATRSAVRLLVRGRWCILVSTFVVSLASVAFVTTLPNRYVSRATLVLVQQKVSQRFVEPESTTTVFGAVEATKLEVLSQDHVLAMIDEFDLYAKERQKLTNEMLVDQMRKEVDIQPLEARPEHDAPAFTISFTASTPQVAQKVTHRIAALFIEQNRKSRSDEVAQTTKFLSDQLEAAKERLAEQEKRLQAFRSSNMGELPEQQQVNMTALANLRVRMETVQSNIDQAQQERTRLENSLQERLDTLEADRATLLRRFTPQHPEVVKKDEEVRELRAALERITSAPVGPNTTSSVVFHDAAVEGFVRQVEGNDAKLMTLRKQQESIQRQMDGYEHRVNLAPVREQQLAEIERDYNLYRQDYNDLLNKKLQAELSASVEENQQGQQFRLVDPPSLPAKPSSPNRLRFSLAGFAGGLAFGLVLAFLVRLRDTSFHTEKALLRSFNVPLAVSIPRIRTPKERRARIVRIVCESLAGGAMMLVVGAVEFYFTHHR